MVVYAVAADASIIRLSLAGFLPGLLLMALLSGYIVWWSLAHPDRVPPADPPTRRPPSSITEVTPPVGFNLFVLQNMTGKDSNTIARAAIPFFACLVLCIGLITVFPAIATWLPDRVMGVER